MLKRGPVYEVRIKYIVYTTRIDDWPDEESRVNEGRVWLVPVAQVGFHGTHCEKPLPANWPEEVERRRNMESILLKAQTMQNRNPTTLTNTDIQAHAQKPTLKQAHNTHNTHNLCDVYIPPAQLVHTPAPEVE